MLLGVHPTFKSQPLAGRPGECVEHAGLIFLPLAALTRRVANRIAGERHLAVIVVAVVVELAAQRQVIAQLPIEVHGHLLHVALIAVVSVFSGRITAVSCQFGLGLKARLFGFMLIDTGDQADLQQLGVIGEKPFAADDIFIRLAVVAVAVGVLLGEEIVLREVTRLAAHGHLHLTGVEAAISQAAVAVVAALAGHEVDVAANVVQAVARVIGAAHHFDVFDIQREHHVDKALVAAVDVARHAVDQGLDAVDVALAVKGTEGRLAGLRALAGFGQLDAGHLPQQLPTVHHVFVFDHLATEHIHGGQHASAGLFHLAGFGFHIL